MLTTSGELINMVKNFTEIDKGKILRAEFKTGFIKRIEGYIKDVENGTAIVQTGGLGLQKVRRSKLKNVKLISLRK